MTLEAQGTPSSPRIERARIFGSAGERPRMAAVFRAMWPLLVVVLLTGYLVRAALPLPALSRAVTGLAFLLVAGVAAWGWIGMGRRIEAFLKGARGEERVARELALLSGEYAVLHGVSVGSSAGASSDFDHVVVGPRGVFVIETKNWSGRITVRDSRLLQDGRRPSRPPLDQLRRAVRGLQQLLADRGGGGMVVQGVVCFAGDTFQPDCWSEPGVTVCNVSVLREWLMEAREASVDAAACERVVDALRDCVAG